MVVVVGVGVGVGVIQVRHGRDLADVLVQQLTRVRAATKKKPSMSHGEAGCINQGGAASSPSAPLYRRT